MSPRGDERAQSVQVGVIILFAFAVLAFSGYQATVVPQQNQEVEFAHSQEIAEDVQTFRNDLLDAAASGRRFSAEFALGTTYPSRIIALNPAPASGSLRTESLGGGEFALVSSGKSLEDVCGYDRDGDGTVPSNGLVYSPSYNFYEDAPTVVYENTVSYRRYSGDTVRFDSDQTLVQGDTIQVPPLLGDVSASSSMTHTVDLYPGKAGVGESVGQSVTLVVPTALSADRWETLLSDQMAPDGPVQSVSPNGSNDNVDVVLESGEYQITCPVMGAGEAPDNSPDRLRGAGDGINPGGPGDVRLSDVELHPDDKDVVVTSFTNPGDDVNITNVRFNFYDAGTQSGPAQMDVANYTRSTTTIDDPPFIQDLVLRGASKSPDPHADLEGGDAVTAFAMEFENADGTTYDVKQDHFAVVYVRFSDGQSANYFIDVPQTSDTVNGGGGGGGGSGTAGFSSYSASDLSGTSSQTQSLSFTISSSMAASNTVSIDLTDTNRNGQREISYSNPNVVSGGGTATIQNRVITYVPPASGLSSGDSVVVEVDATPGKNAPGTTYTVTFSRSDVSGSASTTFTVTN